MYTGPTQSEQTLRPIYPDNNLHSAPDCVTIEIDRAELEQQHRTLVAYLNTLRELLGYPPLPTGKEQRRQETERVSEG